MKKVGCHSHITPVMPDPDPASIIPMGRSHNYQLSISSMMQTAMHNGFRLISWLKPRAGMTVLLLGLLLAPPIFADLLKILDITVKPIELNTENPQQNIVGKLKYIKGYSIASDYEHFGGLSGLSYAREAEDISPVFVSDRGEVGQFKLNQNYKPYFASIQFISGIPWKTSPKKIADAEGIVRLKVKDSDYTLISFEHLHRIMAYSADHKNGKPLPLPAEIGMLRSNGGLETMEALSDGRLFLMAEHPTIKTKQHFGWIGSAPKDNLLDFRYITRLIAPPKGYSPTDATELPNGDVLVLLRRFTPTDGVSAKFWRIKKAMLDSSDTITGEVIATLKPPLNVDNMEGIAVIDISKDGNPIIAVISDDNFNSFQRTLLMIFEIVS